MYVTLFHYWGLIQWLELTGALVLLFGFIYMWSRLWIKDWPGRHAAVVFLCALTTAWPVTMMIHQRVAGNLAAGKFGLYELQQKVKRHTNRHLMSRFDDMAHKAADRQTFIETAIAEYACCLYVDAQSRYLPIDNWPTSTVSPETRSVLGELYDARGLAEFEPDSQDCDTLFKAVCRYLAEQELTQNRESLQELYPYADALLALLLFMVMFICARMAYFSVKQNSCEPYPFL